MSLETQIRWAFRVNAVVNWIVSVRGIVDPLGAAKLFGGPPPSYPFIVQLWSAFVFMFGCMFFEVSRDVRGKVHLAKYNWIEKTLTALAVTSGFLAGAAPPRLMVLVTLTNWVWIPYLAYLDVAYRRGLARSARRLEDDVLEAARVSKHANTHDAAPSRLQEHEGEEHATEDDRDRRLAVEPKDAGALG